MGFEQGGRWEAGLGGEGCVEEERGCGNRRMGRDCITVQITWM